LGKSWEKLGNSLGVFVVKPPIYISLYTVLFMNAEIASGNCNPTGMMMND
jgi:hypothetical protein